LVKTNTTEITYMHSEFNDTIFKKELQTLGLKGSGNNIYSNDAYAVIYRKERMKNSNTHDGMGLPQYITVVTILKK